VADALGVRAMAVWRERVHPAIAARAAPHIPREGAALERRGARCVPGKETRLGTVELQPDGKVQR